MKLHSYWRSSSAYRVRIALNLKSIEHSIEPVSLVADGGEQHLPGYLKKNPAALVPTLELDNGVCIRQSLAIIDYLENAHPLPALLPSEAMKRKEIYAFACDIGMEMQPTNNLRVVQRLKDKYEFTQQMVVDWMSHWMHATFAVLEQAVGADAFCFGGEPTLADVFLVPQMYNASRWELDMSAYPKLCRITERAKAREAFVLAHPDRQSDAKK